MTSLIIILLIVYFAWRGQKKRNAAAGSKAKSENGGSGIGSAKRSAESAGSGAGKHVRNVLEPVSVSGLHGGIAGTSKAIRDELKGSAIIRDDANDWLSRQIAEERRAEARLSAMFGFRFGGKYTPSDAEALKLEHMLQHGRG
ncbi:MAG: hypothetical protein Q4E57_04700 [Eubacteriales bacterium]|nr:hypothetical protein [Eubacteriales bacterium]